MINDKYTEEIKHITKQQDKIFNSIDKKHQIEINIIDEICWFNIIKFEYEYYKTFLLMLKDCLIFLKNNNVEYIKQYIYENDCEYFKNSSIVNIDQNKYIVSTRIENFVDEIICVFGINKI
jgi:hypothetical protein